MWVVGLAAAAAMAVNVASGHAAGAHSPRWATVAAQWAHFAAAGVWLGGLAALLLYLRGTPSETGGTRAAAVRRFSAVALGALGVVVVTGVVRALGELSAWSDLTGTGYGRAVVLKVLLIVAIAGLAMVNRRRNVSRAGNDPGSLRRVSLAEIVLGVGALGTAAVLASLAPPVAGRATADVGVTVAAADFATSVRATLAARPAAPGFNRFELRLEDYDSGDAVPADSVRLRFTALDDPGVAPSTLDLGRSGDHWTGAGGNLAFDGRWGIDVLAHRGADATTVSLELDVLGPPQFLSVERLPGEPVKYTVELAAGGYARVWVQADDAGSDVIHVVFYEPTGDVRPMESVVLTTQTSGGAPRQHAVRMVADGEFEATADLPDSGRPTTVTVVGKGRDGARLRATVAVDPRR